MKILVINGPNINMLGIRNKEIYGERTYKDLVRLVKKHAKEKKISVKLFCSNSEGEIIDKIQMAYNKFSGIIINPAAYTHTSIAIKDALEAVSIPYVEVHISDVDKREDERKISYIRENAVATVMGKSLEGYIEAIDILSESVK